MAKDDEMVEEVMGWYKLLWAVRNTSCARNTQEINCGLTYFLRLSEVLCSKQ